jgi:hypothetical protein
MRDPNHETPYVFDYLWLFWILRHFLPKDLIVEIIGNNKNRKFSYYFNIHRFKHVELTFDNNHLFSYQNWYKGLWVGSKKCMF